MPTIHARSEWTRRAPTRTTPASPCTESADHKPQLEETP